MQVAVYTFWYELKHMIYARMQIHQLTFQTYGLKLAQLILKVTEAIYVHREQK